MYCFNVCGLQFCIIIIKNECHSNINDFKVWPQQKAAVKVKVSHAAVKSFDRRGASCARTVQFSGSIEKCPVTQKTALPLANCSTHDLQLN